MRSILCAAAVVAASASDGRRHLTPVLQSGGDVRKAAKVGPLPGINATSYAGFFEVNATAHAEHFFWHWPALSGNASAPVVVWLQGGPGSSSLFGMWVESGPFSLDAALNPHWRSTTWASDYNMVYLDNPRETGYSYADAGALCTDWQCYAADFDAWLAQFIVAFGFQKNDVYITGESYGGHYVPAAAFAVMQNNAAGRQPTINLAGVAIGNGFVAPYEMQAGYPEIIFNAGLISLENLAVALNYSARITEALDGDDYVGAYLIWDAFLNGDSTPGGAWFTNVTGLTNYFNVATETPPEFGFFVSYVTSPAVRTALAWARSPLQTATWRWSWHWSGTLCSPRSRASRRCCKVRESAGLRARDRVCGTSCAQPPPPPPRNARSPLPSRAPLPVRSWQEGAHLQRRAGPHLRRAAHGALPAAARVAGVGRLGADAALAVARHELPGRRHCRLLPRHGQPHAGRYSRRWAYGADGPAISLAGHDVALHRRPRL